MPVIIRGYCMMCTQSASNHNHPGIQITKAAASTTAFLNFVPIAIGIILCIKNYHFLVWKRELTTSSLLPGVYL